MPALTANSLHLRWKSVKKKQEEAAKKALTQARHKKLYSNKRKRNEEQVMLNAQLNDMLAEVKVDLPGAGVTGNSVAQHTWNFAELTDY